MVCWGYFAALALLCVFCLTGRRRPWAFLWWVPATGGLLALAGYLVFVVDDGLPAPAGPGGGGEGLAFLVTNAARCVVVVAAVACGLAFPPGSDRA